MDKVELSNLIVAPVNEIADDLAEMVLIRFPIRNYAIIEQ